MERVKGEDVMGKDNVNEVGTLQEYRGYGYSGCLCVRRWHQWWGEGGGKGAEDGGEIICVFDVRR